VSGRILAYVALVFAGCIVAAVSNSASGSRASDCAAVMEALQTGMGEIETAASEDKSSRQETAAVATIERTGDAYASAARHLRGITHYDDTSVEAASEDLAEQLDNEAKALHLLAGATRNGRTYTIASLKEDAEKAEASLGKDMASARRLCSP
jgi:hypothetical protein